MPKIISSLRRRRVPQFLGIYLGASWAVIQFVDWLVQRYLLTPSLTDAALIVLVTLTPAVLLLAYYHGAPGRQPWGRAGKIAVPLNLLVTLGLLGMFLQGRDLEASARNVTVTDENGAEVTQLVPTAAARRKVALFFWPNDSGEPEFDWLQYGLPILVARDLTQNPFLGIWRPSGGYNRGIYNRLVRAGFPAAVGEPTALQRQIATDWRCDAFISGRLATSQEGLRAHVVIHRLDALGENVELELVADDAVSLADAATKAILDHIGLPEGHDRLSQDLPIADITSGNETALRAFVDGAMVEIVENDYVAAAQSFQDAIDADAGFALAHLRKAQTLIFGGGTTRGTEAINTALRHNYRLTEDDIFELKGMRYLLEGETDKRIRLYEMRAELQPTDVNALAGLAMVYKWSGNRVVEAQTAYRQILQHHPAESWVLNEIASLDLLRGRTQEAIQTLNQYAARHPEDHGTLLRIGSIQREQGDLQGAQKSFEEASLMASGYVQPSIDLADIALRLGQWQEAQEHIGDARAIAQDPLQKALVSSKQIELLTLRGQIANALALVPELADYHRQFDQPINVLFSVYIQNALLYVEAGEGDRLKQILDDAKKKLGPPFDRYLASGDMLFAAFDGDVARAREAREILEALIAEHDREDLRFMTEMVRGMELRADGQTAEAIAAYEGALTAWQGSVQTGGEGGALKILLLTELGGLHRQNSDLASAQQRLDEALTLRPAGPLIHLELAKLARDRQQLDQAQHHIDRALDAWAQADTFSRAAAEARALRDTLGSDSVSS